jgi:hypothetical protein
MCKKNSVKDEKEVLVIYLRNHEKVANTLFDMHSQLPYFLAD